MGKFIVWINEGNGLYNPHVAEDEAEVLSILLERVDGREFLVTPDVLSVGLTLQPKREPTLMESAGMAGDFQTKPLPERKDLEDPLEVLTRFVIKGKDITGLYEAINELHKQYSPYYEGD